MAIGDGCVKFPDLLPVTLVAVGTLGFGPGRCQAPFAVPVRLLLCQQGRLVKAGVPERSTQQRCRQQCR